MSTDPTLVEGGKPPPTPASLLGGVPGTLLAIATALGGLFTTYQSYQTSEATSRASYETLKVAVERNTEALAAQANAQAELRLWVQDLSERLERRQVNTEKALARKVTKRSAPAAPIVVPPSEPVPPAPPPPPAPSPAALPSFDGLKTIEGCFRSGLRENICTECGRPWLTRESTPLCPVCNPSHVGYHPGGAPPHDKARWMLFWRSHFTGVLRSRAADHQLRQRLLDHAEATSPSVYPPNTRASAIIAELNELPFALDERDPEWREGWSRS
jgi:hypothetical protein